MVSEQKQPITSKADD